MSARDPKRHESSTPETDRDKRNDRGGAPRPDLRRDDPNVTDHPARREEDIQPDPRRDDRPRPTYPDPAPIAGEDEDGALEHRA